MGGKRVNTAVLSPWSWNPEAKEAEVEEGGETDEEGPEAGVRASGEGKGGMD